MSYHTEIVRLVTEECAAGSGHKKVLEPLCNMVASVAAGIDEEHNEEVMPFIKSQIDKMYAQYRQAYAVKKEKAN